MRYNHKTQSKSIEMNTIKIGSQEWATEDLKVTKFRNGEDIPLVKDNDEWRHMDSAAYCITPDGNYLYNWYAVIDPRGLAPQGFHVPTDDEWTQLTKLFGGGDIAGGKLKCTDRGGDNSSGFSALLGGYRDNYGGYFGYVGVNGYWWSSSPSGSYAWSRGLHSINSDFDRDHYDLRFGFSVRCIKNKNQMKPELMSASFTFGQEGNTEGTTSEYEEITIEYQNPFDLHHGFFVLRTEGWSIDNAAACDQRAPFA